VWFYPAVITLWDACDYIFLSPAMARDWVMVETYVPTIPNWGIGSDHRPIVATFTTANQ
jgi:endonuclease/exonuclease/phosphatase family metal-dependent hydrolase